MAKKKFPVPVDEDGNLIPVVLEETPWRKATPVAKWIEDPAVFLATMTFAGIAKGKYSDRFTFTNEGGQSFTMTGPDFCKAVPYLEEGKLKDQVFRWSKFHNKYGIALAL